MNKGLIVVGVGALVLGASAAAYAASKDDELPLPLPEDGCSTAQDVTEATNSVLTDPNVTAKGCREAAAVLKSWDNYCDEQAKLAGQASIAVLEAKATALESGQPSGNPLPLPLPPGVPALQIPFPGWVGREYHRTGLHGEVGTLYWYANGDEWFIPNDPMLAPYYIPGGSAELPHPTTTGTCCAACERGEECEGCS